LTAFAYLKEFESGNNTISQGSVDNYLGIILNCGYFSYSKMIDSFNVVLGVTGTLDTLSKTQQDVVNKEYKI